MNKLKADCFIDQYNNIVWAKTRKELLKKLGYKSCHKMYRDKKDGTSAHCGYVVGQQWLSAFTTSEV